MNTMNRVDLVELALRQYRMRVESIDYDLYSGSITTEQAIDELNDAREVLLSDIRKAVNE